MYTSNNHHAGGPQAQAPAPAGYSAYPPMYYPHHAPPPQHGGPQQQHHGGGPRQQQQHHYPPMPHAGHGQGPPQPPQGYAAPPHPQHSQSSSPRNSPSAMGPPQSHPQHMMYQQHPPHMQHHGSHPPQGHPPQSHEPGSSMHHAGPHPPQSHEQPIPESREPGDANGHKTFDPNGPIEGSADYHHDQQTPGISSREEEETYPPGGEGERNSQEGEKQPMVPYSQQHMPPPPSNASHHEAMPAHGYPPQGYHHAPQYPTHHQHAQPPQHPYYHQPPPVGSYPPPESWNAHPPHPSMYMPQHHDPANPNSHPIAPPYQYYGGAYQHHPPSNTTSMGQQQDRSPPRADGRLNDKKQTRTAKGPSPHNPNPTLSSNEPKYVHRTQNPPAKQQSPAPPPAYASGKSVRRKKKMYSDFVGVTYNKTHAKYQACITHYRKQHYLGRYKLAVDAALAYDESARLLKGASWKVNFPTSDAYEDAKTKEIETLGKRLGGVGKVDLAGGLAAVKNKVEEIAAAAGIAQRGVANFGNGPSSFYSVNRLKRTIAASGAAARPVPVSNYRSGPRRAAVGFESLHTEQHEKRLKTRHTPYDPAMSTPAMSKVTPSPTFPVGSVPVEEEEEQNKSPIPLINQELRSFERTPLEASPNPTRHAMGAEKSTPDSVIRPMALTYYKGGNKDGVLVVPGSVPSSVPSATDVGNKSLPLALPATKGLDSTPKQRNAKATLVAPHTLPSKSSMATTPRAKTAGKSPPRSAPPLIQNGTLAAASALMTLFGNEKSPAKE